MVPKLFSYALYINNKNCLARPSDCLTHPPNCEHYVCLGGFIKERNKKERDRKEICYFYSLDEERNKERKKYNG
jgi:hypothetical protein